MNVLDIIRKIAVEIVLKVASVLLAVMLLCLFLQVFFRYVLSHPLSWSEEVARFTFAWVAILGAAGTITGSIAQGIDYLTKKLPIRFQGVLNIVIRSSMLVFFLIMTVKGGQLTKIVHLQTSPALGIPMSYVYSAIPVGFGFMILILGIDSIVNFKKVLNKDQLREG